MGRNFIEIVFWFTLGLLAGPALVFFMMPFVLVIVYQYKNMGRIKDGL